jgi:hypothetical protein
MAYALGGYVFGLGQKTNFSLTTVLNCTSFPVNSLYVEGLSPEKEADAMADTLIVFFPHRRNPDGCFDSICLTCFATIGTAKTARDLRGDEKNHVCNPSTLSQRAFDRSVIERIKRPLIGWRD